MSWISKLFGAASAEELAGLSLGSDEPVWQVSGPKDFPALFRCLPSILPPGAILYLEGGFHWGKLKEFVEQASIPEPVHIALGTIWPKPAYFHIPASKENLARLSALSEDYATPEIAVHFHIHADNKVLIEWHDAFGEPMLMSTDFTEDSIKRFCKDLSMTYTKLEKK